MHVPGMAFDNQRSGTKGPLRRLATRVPGARSRQRARAAVARPPSDPDVGAGRTPTRPDPVLRWRDPSRAPAGAFAPCAVPNGQLRVHGIPDHTGTWDAVASFCLSYDGYAYWDDVSELATRSIRNWTRAHALPDSIDEVRACLFYEQRRWHHFGEEPNGRGAQYVWALLDSLRNLVAARAVPTAPPADAAEPRCVFVTTPGPVRSFLDDDAGYLAWVSSHSGGFVVNADRTLSPNSLMLHRATCSCIGGPARPGRTRTGHYRKVCAADLESLVDWCRMDIGVDPGCCGHCHPWSPSSPG